MGTTIVDVRLSSALSPRELDQAAAESLDMPGEDVARTVTTLGEQPWQVARAHLVERVGEPFRCELFLTRIETTAQDPSTPPTAAPPRTFFERASDAMDAAQNATDPMRGQNWLTPGAGPMGIPGIGGLPAAAAQAATQLANVATGLPGIAPNFNNWEQDLLGIQPPGPRWSPEAPPDPAEYLGSFRSVLLRRVGPVDGAPLMGRWISGIVTEFEDLGPYGMDGYRCVRIVIEPQLSLLSLRSGYRIFERQNVVEIAQKIFEEAGVYSGSGFQLELDASTLPRRPHCIQYGETDLDFVLRLFSEEGLVPTFESHLGVETLRLWTPAGLQARLDRRVTTLDPADLPRDALVLGAATSTTEELVWGFSVRRVLRPTEVHLRATNFSAYPADGVRPSHLDAADGGDHRIPTHVEEGVARSTDDTSPERAFAPSIRLDVHQFPARTSFDFAPDTAVQTNLVDPNVEASLELQAVRAEVLRARGRSNAIALAAGTHAQVQDGLGVDPLIYDDAVRPFGRSFYVTALEMLVETGQAALGPNGVLGHLPRRPLRFSGTAALDVEAIVDAVPSEVAYVPERRRAPRVDGVQTAITKAGPTVWQEGTSRIGVDSIGRVRARMPWDARTDADVSSGEQPLSPPIRMAGPWAGHAWGTTFLPREGMELVVAFVHGDPTQPIALGAVHGFANPAPRERPHLEVIGKDAPKENHLGDEEVKNGRLHYKEDHAIQPDGERHINMIRTQIDPAPEARARAYHELSFDDTPGKERVRIHSEGVLEETVERDHRTLVGRDQTNIVQGKQKESVANQELIVEGTRTKVVTGHEVELVHGKQTTLVFGQKSSWVDRDRTREVGADGSGDVREEIGDKVGAGVSRMLTSKSHRRTVVEGNDTRTVGGNVVETIGGTYQLGGAPLAMKATAGAAAGAPRAAPSVKSDESELELDGGAAEAELRAEGDVHVKAGVMKLFGSTGVRFECGDELWLELTPEGIVAHAPGGLDVRTMSVDPVVKAELGIGRLGEAGAIDLRLKEWLRPDGEAKGTFHAILRAGPGGGDPHDALEGGPGVSIDPVDTLAIDGGLASFACRRVEIQKGNEAKTVVRRPTEEDEQVVRDIARLDGEIAELRRDVKRLEMERDTARALYRLAAGRRELVQLKIEVERGKDDELSEAVAEVVAAERALERAKAEEAAARLAYDRAFRAGEDTRDEEERLEEAREAVEETEEELRDANEELDEQREDHGKLVQEYEDARAHEKKREQELYAKQDELARAVHELRQKEAELEALRRRAAVLELDDPTQPSTPDAPQQPTQEAAE
jgi:type VI secretion system secreted protein VgrG